MKKFLLTVAALIIFCVPLICSAAGDSATSKLVQMEQDTYGAEQTGAILDRITRLEKKYSGRNMQGNMNTRIDAIYDILYKNVGAPGILAKINAVEWNAYHEVSDKNIISRIENLENEILGKTSNGTIIKRIDALAQASFGNKQIPLAEMQIPDNTLIKVELTENIDSKTLQVGDIVDIKVAENTFVDGKLIFAKGLHGKGKVESVRKAKGWTGTNGKVKIDFFMLNCIDGTSVDIYVGTAAQKEMTAQKMIQGAMLVGMNLNNDWNKIMVHGKNVEITAGTELYVQTKKNFGLYGLNTESANLNFS